MNERRGTAELSIGNVTMSNRITLHTIPECLSGNYLNHKPQNNIKVIDGYLTTYPTFAAFVQLTYKTVIIQMYAVDPQNHKIFVHIPTSNIWVHKSSTSTKHQKAYSYAYLLVNPYLSQRELRICGISKNIQEGLQDSWKILYQGGQRLFWSLYGILYSRSRRPLTS